MENNALPPNPLMVDLVKKKNDLLRAIQLLTDEITDLIKRKRQLEMANRDLDIKSVKKLQELKEISEQMIELRAKVSGVQARTDKIENKN